MTPAPTWALIAGGGTAGHTLPGIAVADALVARGHEAESLHFVGSERGTEGRLVPDAGFTQVGFLLPSLISPFTFTSFSALSRSRPMLVIGIAPVVTIGLPA